eukprot:6007140-Alexandrium_andersonii.AAC.1
MAPKRAAPRVRSSRAGGTNWLAVLPQALQVPLAERPGPFLPLPSESPSPAAFRRLLLSTLPDGVQPAGKALERVAWAGLLRRATVEATAIAATDPESAELWRRTVDEKVRARKDVLMHRRSAFFTAQATAEEQRLDNWMAGERLLGLLGAVRQDGAG